ncbi:hypothetical protein CspHIS471_0601860 [Cutaneotrichosporon sp. HIS471]|nr:hypothetical protein CspHIS471_0601860 [Cutaneotrichosporon sp. HIS471]
MRASTAHSALLLVATLVALAAVGCNGYMLYHVQRAFASSPSPTSYFRWRVLLISAEAVSGATAITLATTPLFGLAPAYMSPGARTSSLSQGGTFGKGKNPYRTPSTRSTNPYPSRDESIYLSPRSPMDNPYRSTSRDENPYRSPRSPMDNPYVHRSTSRGENLYRSPRKENPYKTSKNMLQPPIERDRAKLSMEQIDRKRTLFADGML